MTEPRPEQETDPQATPSHGSADASRTPRMRASRE